MGFLQAIRRLISRAPETESGTIRLRDGDALLVSVKDGVIIAKTFDIVLSHAEFVKRSLGVLPDGAWVGTVRKFGKQVVAINSKTFYGNQLPAAESVQAVVKAAFR